MNKKKRIIIWTGIAAVLVIVTVTLALVLNNKKSKDSDKTIEVVDVLPDETQNRNETDAETEKSTETETEKTTESEKSTEIDNDINEEVKPDSQYARVTLHFENKTETKSVKRGTLINSLEAPVLDNLVFLRWYYDRDFNNSVKNGDAVTEDIDLYGKFGEASPIEGYGANNYLAQMDVSPDFSIVVIATDKDEKFVLDNLTLKNLSNSSRTDDSKTMFKDELAVERIGDGKFRVYVKNGFNEGDSYQIEKHSDSIVFDGSVKEVIYYNITVAKQEVMNLSLDGDIKYLSVSELSKADREKILTYQGLFSMHTDSVTGDIQYKENNAEGIFTYRTGAFKKGDTVAVYEGTRPDLRGLEYEGDKGTSYITITNVNGTEYSYRSADTENVIFFPDVLPIDIDENDGVTGWRANGTSFTIINEKLDFSEGYEELGLGASTSLDTGDFLAFYTGTYGSDNQKLKEYGKVTKIIPNGYSTTFEYETVTFDEMKKSMDLFQKSQLTDEQIEESIDKQYLTHLVGEQLAQSGFIEEATEYLSYMALQTDEVQALMGDTDLNLDNCTITFKDEEGKEIPKDELVLLGDQFNFIGDNSKDTGTKLSINITPKLVHFKDRGKGVRVEIAFTYKFDVQKTGAKHKVEVELTAVFEAEILFDLSVDGEIIWDWAVFIPYIYDYKLSGKFDRGVYSGIAITATAKLDEDEGPFKLPFEAGNELNVPAKQIYDIGKAIQDKLKTSPDPFADSKATASGDFVDKYSDFVEETSKQWVDLFELPLFEASGSFDSFGISAYGITGVFVASANMNVALGITVQAEDSQRNEFSLMLIHRKSEAETLNTGTTALRFDMYVFGVLGIRCGVRVKVLFGVFSTKLAGIGLRVEGGVYAKLYGYFYYTYSWEKGKGSESIAKGALLLDVGLYVDIRFVAEVLNGKFGFMPTLYSNEWSLWTAGSKYDVQDFAYNQNGSWVEYVDGRKIEYRVPTSLKWINDKEYTLPSDVFQAKALDLTNGEFGTMNMDSNKAGTVTSKDPEGDDEENFIIEIENKKVFRYDPKDNKIYVTPDDSYEIEFETDLTITWKQPSLSFSTQTLSRTIHLTWIDMSSGSVINFDTKGGCCIDPIYGKAGKPVTKPEYNPTRTGYEFVGWFADEACTIPYVFPDRMPDYDTTVYAKWIPAPNKLHIKYYMENEAGKYEYYGSRYDYSVYTEDKITDELLEKNTDKMEGFYVDSKRTYRSNMVAPYKGGEAIIYYARKTYTVTFTYGDQKNSTNKDVVLNVRYGSPISIPNFFVKGYLCEGFDGDIPALMPAKNLTFNCKWQPRPDTKYYIHNYVKKPDSDEYVVYTGENAVISDIGATGSFVDIDKITVDKVGYTLDRIECNNMKDSKPYISGYEDTIVKLYYTAQTYNVVLDAAEGTLDKNVTSYVRGTRVALPTPKRTGYDFIGWWDGIKYVTEIDCSDYGDKSFVAKYEPVVSVVMFNNGKSDTKSDYANNTYGSTPDKLSTLPVLNGYRFLGYYDKQTGGVMYYDSEGKACRNWDKTEKDIILYAQFEANGYVVSFNPNGGECAAVNANVIFDTYYGELPTASKTGYVFDGWYTKAQGGTKITENTLVNIASDHTLYAHWHAKTDTKYVVEHYTESVGGAFLLDSTKVYYGTTDSIATAPEQNILGYKLDKSNENTVSSALIKGDGTTVLKLFYLRRSFKITYSNPDNSEKSESSAKYLDVVRVDTDIVFTRKNYKFAGWLLDNYRVVEFEMPAKDVILVADFVGNSYTVQYDANADALGTVTGTVPDSDAVYDTAFSLRDNGYTVAGYAFDSWNTKADGTGTRYLAGQSVKNLASEDGAVVKLYAQWIPGENIEYTVKVLVRRVDFETDENGNDRYYLCDDYQQMDSFTKTGIAGKKAELTAEELDYSPGYILEKIDDVSIMGDGSTVVKVYYTREVFDIIYNFDGGSTTDTDYSQGKWFYGVTVTKPSKEKVTKPGYSFNGWNEETDFEGKTITYTATWKAVYGEYGYKQNVYLENLNGEFVYDTTYTKSIYGTPGKERTISSSPSTGYEFSEETNNGDYELDENGNALITFILQGDGSAEINVYMKRKYYNLSYDLQGITPTNEGEYTPEGPVKYGAPVVLPIIEKAGYDVEMLPYALSEMPYQDMEISVKLTARTDIPYKLVYYLEDVEPDEYGNPKYTKSEYVKELSNGVTDSTVEKYIIDLYKKSYTTSDNPDYYGFKFIGYEENKTIEGDGSTEIGLFFTRNMYRLNIDFRGAVPKEGVEYSKPGYYKYGAKLYLPDADKDELIYHGAILNPSLDHGGEMTMSYCNTGALNFSYPLYYTDYDIEYVFEDGGKISNSYTEQLPKTFRAENDTFTIAPPSNFNVNQKIFIAWEIYESEDYTCHNIENYGNTVIFHPGAYLEYADENNKPKLKIKLIYTVATDEIPVELDGGTIFNQTDSTKYVYRKEDENTVNKHTLSDIPTPTKDGYVFSHWTDKNSGGEVDLSRTLVDIRTSGVVLKANWLVYDSANRSIGIRNQEEFTYAIRTANRLINELSEAERTVMWGTYGYRLHLENDIEVKNLYDFLIDSLNCDLDGKGHTVTFGENCYSSLIYVIESDVTLSNLKITGKAMSFILQPEYDNRGVNYTGGASFLCNKVKGNVDNVNIFNAELIACGNSNKMDNAGLIAAFCDGGYINECVIQNAKIVGNNNVGAIVGNATNGYIRCCRIYGVNIKAYEYVGMMAGRFSGTIYASEVGIKDYLSLGTVDENIIDASNYVGGMVGMLNADSHTKQNDIMDITIKAFDYIGGFVGYSYGVFNEKQYDYISHLRNVYIEGYRAIGGVVGWTDNTEFQAYCVGMKNVVMRAEDECRPLCGNRDVESKFKISYAMDVDYNTLKFNYTKKP